MNVTTETKRTIPVLFCEEDQPLDIRMKRLPPGPSSLARWLRPWGHPSCRKRFIFRIKRAID